MLPGWIDGKLALAQRDADQQTGKIIMVTSAEKLMGSPYFLPSGELLVLPNKSGDQTPLILTPIAAGPTGGQMTPGPAKITTDEDWRDRRQHSPSPDRQR